MVGGEWTKLEIIETIEEEIEVARVAQSREREMGLEWRRF